MERRDKLTSTILDNEYERFKDYQSNTQMDLGSVISRREVSTSARVNMKPNVLGQVRVIVLASIVALLGFLLIYNMFAMSQVSANIAVTEQMIISEQASVDLLKEKLAVVNNEAVILQNVASAGYIDGAGTVVAVSTLPEVAPITYEEQTNWFDQICQFFASIFGGR